MYAQVRAKVKYEIALHSSWEKIKRPVRVMTSMARKKKKTLKWSSVAQSA